MRIHANVTFTYAEYVYRQSVVVGHWLTGARVLLLRAADADLTTAVPDASFSVKNFTPVISMSAAGAYPWRP